MKDLISFLLRGAWAAAICGGTAWLLFCMYAYGPFWGLLTIFHPALLVYLAVPGTIVGLTLWFLTGRTGRCLTAASRIAIGTGVVFVLLLALMIYQLVWQVNQLGLIEFNFTWILPSMLIKALVLGGTAGLACPFCQELSNEESKTCYWERVALYEMAEREARRAREERAHKSIG